MVIANASLFAYQRAQNPIPQNVLNKYEELSKKYAESLGASLQACENRAIKVYAVRGLGGFSGIIIYFNESGRELGENRLNDSPVPGIPTPAPPVNISEFKCQTIKVSQPGK